MVEDAIVALLPSHPGHKEGDGGQPLMHGLGRGLPGVAAPIVQGVVRVRWPAGYAEPHKDVVPDLLHEGAGKDEVVHRFRLLVTEQASRQLKIPEAA